MKKNRLKNYVSWYILLIIPILGTFIFNIYPLVNTFTDSFQNMKNIFIGTINYDIMFHDTEFRQSIINTLYMAVLGVGFNIPIAFVIANMLNSIPKSKNIFKVVFLLPMIMSMVTVAILFKYIFMPDEDGIANYFLSFFGIAPKGFFNDPGMARESVVTMAIWKGVGYNIIMFFAGLQTVSKELYEAAEIDGANEWKKFSRITIPCMKNTFTYVLITSTISALKRFAEVYAVSGEYGSPSGALNTMMLYIYKKSFSTLNYKDIGLASAASVTLFLIILLITALNYYLTEKENFRFGSILKRKAGRR